MAVLGVEDLHRLLSEIAGEADGGFTPDAFPDQEFDDLGYDSLALMEAAARISQQYGVEVPEDLLLDLRTPRELLDVVNGAVAEHS